jgi:flagellar basal-body rod protein FlgB
MKLFLILFLLLSTISVNADSEKKITIFKSNTKNAKQYNTNDLFKSYLVLSSFRHKVLAQNIANVNTPGYKADEVEIPDNYEDLVGTGRISRKISMKKTSSKHISGIGDSNGNFASHKLKDPYEIKKNGNNVSMIQQTSKISQNQSNYNSAVKGYATLNSLYSTVIGK